MPCWRVLLELICYVLKQLLFLTFFLISLSLFFISLLLLLLLVLLLLLLPLLLLPLLLLLSYCLGRGKGKIKKQNNVEKTPSKYVLIDEF